MRSSTIIERVENGFMLTDRHEYEDGSSDESITVLEEGDNEDETMVKLLLKVAESVGYNEDKYGSENINITFDRKGRKVE